MTTAVSPLGVVCPICCTWYSRSVRIPGQVCGDMSQRQTRRCVGRLISQMKLAKAEWRNNPTPACVRRNLAIASEPTR